MRNYSRGALTVQAYTDVHRGEAAQPLVVAPDPQTNRLEASGSPNQEIQQEIAAPQPAISFGVDDRETLWNELCIGKIEEIQLPASMITSVRGILFDLDPKIIRPSAFLPDVPADPHEFYATVARAWLNRHLVLAKAEVRMSGTGLHAILRFGEPCLIESDGDRQRWQGIIQVVQAALPVDPDQPHLTANTRPVGSVNSKNGATIELLAAGSPVTVEEVLQLYNDMRNRPFATVMQLLCGTDRLTPCPKCGSPGSSLSALHSSGRCYGRCGTLRVRDLYELILQPRDSDAQ